MPVEAGEIDAFIITGVGMANCVVISIGVVGDIGPVEERKQEKKKDCGDCYCGNCTRIERTGGPPVDDQGWH